MSYLDPKEQVLDLQLTPYGKFLLSIGKLNPVYYAFFDDDVVYDSTYASVNSEGQNSIEPRIQEETPRFSAQSTVDGIESDFTAKKETFKEMEEQIAEEFTASGIAEGFAFTEKQELAFFKQTPVPDLKRLREQPLGRFKTSAGYAPAWNAAFFKAPLDSATDYLTISGPKGDMDYIIPQLNVNIEYRVQRNSRKFSEKNMPGIFFDESDPSAFGKKAKELGYNESFGAVFYQDNTNIFIARDYLVIRLEESHTNFEKDNFEIEFFEVFENALGEEVLYKRKFYQEYSQYVEDSLESYGVDPNVVERDFNLFVDEEIQQDVICPLILKDKTKQFYTKRMFDCENFAEDGGIDNIYLDVDDTEDICEQ